MDMQSFIAQLNSAHEWEPREYHSVEVKARAEYLAGIRAVFFDVYGTLVDYYQEAFRDEESKQQHILSCFQHVIDDFALSDALFDIRPDAGEAHTLRDFYHGLIVMQHEKSAAQGVAFPEIKIEEIWGTLLQMFARHGYEVPRPGWQSAEEMAQAMAYQYNFFALGRRMYPGVVPMLGLFRQRNLVLGLISNAQFYTIPDLSWLLMRQGGGSGQDAYSYFPIDNCFFSFQYGVSKPNPQLFDEALTFLQRMRIRSNEVLYVGNDLFNDIYGAGQCGMRTALYCGDRDTLALAKDREEARGAVPDLAVKSWADLGGSIV